jgi:trimeric autotransporter adhesin
MDFQEDCMRRMTLLVLLLTALLLSFPALAQQDIVTTYIGGGPNAIPALSSDLYSIDQIAADASGNYYFTSYYQNRVYKVNAAGTLTVLAGSGATGFTGDGVVGGAATASLNRPQGLAVDSSGNVYFADQYNCVVRKISTAGTITTIAGVGGSCTYDGDTGKGILAHLNYPYGVALDTLGNLFISDTNNCRIRKVVLATDIITTYAGTGACSYTGDTAPASTATVAYPAGLAMDTANDLFIADTNNYVIRKITKASGKITTVAGNHTCCFSGDGASALSAQMNYVYGLAVNGAGTIVTIADYYNQRIRQFTVGGNIDTIAGNGSATFGGDGALATAANLNYPGGIAVSGSNYYIADTNNYRVRQFTVGGNIQTVAGNGSSNLATLLDGVPPKGVTFYDPVGVFGDSAGNIWVNDYYYYMVREFVKASNTVNFFAGNGTSGYSGNGGLATDAQLTSNYGTVKDSKGNVYITDTYNCVIRIVDTAGNINDFAGTHSCGYAGDGGAATSAKLYYPTGLAVDSKDNIYIADTSNHVIREVVNGTINTIAGIAGQARYSGDGGPATSATLYNPYGVTVDKLGNVFIADTSNCRIREVVLATGIISTVAGTGSCTFTGDGPATQEAVSSPYGVRVDANDNLFIADTNNQRLRWVSPSGIMTTFAGTGTAGYYGDTGVATAAQFYSPYAIHEDGAGNFYVADENNFRIRKVSAFAGLGASTGNLSFALTSVGAISAPESVTISAVGPLTISDIIVSGPFSEVDNCPASMPNGTTCTMYVYFTPTGGGSATGAVTITTNGFFNNTSTIGLNGLGTAMSVTGGPLAFANQLVKTTSAAKTVTVSNTGNTAITMGTITLSDATDFNLASNTCPASGAKLNGNTSCTLGVTFKPQSTGTLKGTVVIKDSDPTLAQLVGLTGTGISHMAFSPTTVTFATTAIGVTSLATKITVTNNTAGSVTLDAAAAVTVTAPFLKTAATTCTNGLVVPAGGGCFIYVAYKPTVVGLATGTVSLTDSDSTSPQTAALRGTGTGIKFSPASVNFGLVNRGSQVNSVITLYNVGTTNVYFSGAEFSGTDSADFTYSGFNQAPCYSGYILPGTNCTFTVYFTPSKDGVENATYKLYDNSPGSPQTLKLTGTGQN